MSTDIGLLLDSKQGDNYTWASMNFFQHFAVKKTSLPLPAEKLSSLYVQWAAYKYATCKECLWIKSLFAPKTKGSQTVLRLILSEKIILNENNTSAFH